MKDKRISVICATPPKPNPGMASVDLGFDSFARRCRLTGNINYYQLILTAEHHAGRSEAVREEITSRENLPFEYRCMRGALPEIYESDIIIFWGDFTHMLRHINVVVSRLVNLGIVSSAEEGLSVCYSHYFLSEAPDEVLKKVVVFGETILFNNLSSYADPVYARHFTRLFSNARHVYLRDVYSAFNLAHVLADYSGDFLGMDCSLMFKQSDLERLSPDGGSTGSSRAPAGVGVFFGRSKCTPKSLGKFSRELCRAMGEKAQWVSWWYSSSSYKMGRKVRAGFRELQGVEKQSSPSLGELYRQISGCKFIITDTYHLCLNAWKLGVPAVCIGQAYSRAAVVNCGDIMAQRDKRNVFYSMYEALGYYVYAEEIDKSASRKERILYLASLLSDERYKEAVSKRIKAHAEHVEHKLCGDLGGMLK